MQNKALAFKIMQIKLNMANFDDKKLLRNKKVIEEINRHKWLESEIAGYDIGFEAAAEDWLNKYAEIWIAHQSKNKPKSDKAASPKKKTSDK